MTSTLSARDRVLRAISLREPDKVPFDLTLTVDVYNRLRRHLGLPPEDKKVGFWTNVSPSLDLLDAMETDIVHISLNPPENWTAPDKGDGLLYDEWDIGRDKIVRSDGSYYYEMVKPPLAEAGLEDIAAFDWPDPRDPGRVRGLREQTEDLRRRTDKAFMAKFSNSIWEQSWWLRGLENWMMDLVLNPDIAHAILERVTESAIAFAEAGLDAIGDMVDILRLSGDDMGTQNGPMISPDLYREMIKPYFEHYWSTVKKKLLAKNPHAKMQLHSCGNIRPFIPDWIEMGLDILEPVQPNVRGMEPEGLKEDFGDILAFHGGIDLQRLLPFGTVREVKDEVHRYIDALGPGGGYIVAPAHNVQCDVPPENLIAIRDAIREYGYYR